MTKEQIVEKLCESDIEMIKASLTEDDEEYLYELLDYGFKGYSNYTLEELQIEYEQRSYIYKR